jgi:hypothetical protein
MVSFTHKLYCHIRVLTSLTPKSRAENKAILSLLVNEDPSPIIEYFEKYHIPMIRGNGELKHFSPSGRISIEVFLMHTYVRMCVHAYMCIDDRYSDDYFSYEDVKRFDEAVLSNIKGSIAYEEMNKFKVNF